MNELVEQPANRPRALAAAGVCLAGGIGLGILVGLRLDRLVESKRGGEPGGDRL